MFDCMCCSSLCLLPSQYVAVDTEYEGGGRLLPIQQELERVESHVKRLELSLGAEDTGKAASWVPADQVDRFLGGKQHSRYVLVYCTAIELLYCP